MITIGRVMAAHGLRGELKVEPLTDDPTRFASLKRVFISDQEYAVRSVRGLPHRLLLKLDTIGDSESASKLRGKYIQIPTNESLDLPQDAYYHYQLIGLRVRTTHGDDLGTVKEILPLEANDVYVVQGSRGEVLIPALKSVVTNVDTEGSEITVEPVPGLLPWDDM